MDVPEERDERLETTLVRAVGALEEAGVPYALMGGLASAVLGRGRHTRDVDLFVAPGDAERALKALGRAGFRTERTDQRWLFKAFWEDTMVDLIFVSKGGVRFDAEVRSHLRRTTVRGRPVDTLGPEDMLVIKALANAEHVPRHWYDGLGLLEAGAIDWPYLARRARPHARRVASLLLYALAEGIDVPPERVRELFEFALEARDTAETEAHHHVAARLREALATDPRVNEPDLCLQVSGEAVVVRGQVATLERKQAVDTVLREQVEPGHVRNEVEVLGE